MENRTPVEDDRRFQWEVVLDDADYRATARAYAEQLRRNSVRSKWLVALSWLMLVAVLVAVFSFVEPDRLAASYFGFVGGAFAVLLASTIYNRLAMPRAIERLSGTKDVAITVTIDATGIESRMRDNLVWFAWLNISSVSETGTHYFLWPKSMYALVLPKRVMRNADEAAQFERALADWAPKASAGVVP